MVWVGVAGTHRALGVNVDPPLNKAGESDEVPTSCVVEQRSNSALRWLRLRLRWSKFPPHSLHGGVNNSRRVGEVVVGEVVLLARVADETCVARRRSSGRDIWPVRSCLSAS